ncbi:MAG: class I SAM-dependent methyltransferase family protein [Thermoplasmata archaeon]|nr:class I SAM-dependent methyltransferase family protein [Thermoplasmata archaeon]
MSARRPGPAERVRARIARQCGSATSDALPRGFQRLGRVLVLRLDESLRPAYADIGAAWQVEFGVSTVLRHAGRTDGQWRQPRCEVIAGTSTETEVLEHGVRYRFDAAKIMFAAGNAIERQRIGRLVQPGETVVDLFAGIGYFSVPAALPGRAAEVWAAEANPVSFHYLEENVRRNRVGERVKPLFGDNRAVRIPRGVGDRLILGLLPSSLPWLDRAIELARPRAWAHVHAVAGAREGTGELVDRVCGAVRTAGREVQQTSVREVKPYGPGRAHFVVDVQFDSRTHS